MREGLSNIALSGALAELPEVNHPWTRITGKQGGDQGARKKNINFFHSIEVVMESKVSQRKIFKMLVILLRACIIGQTIQYVYKDYNRCHFAFGFSMHFVEVEIDKSNADTNRVLRDTSILFRGLYTIFGVV